MEEAAKAEVRVAVERVVATAAATAVVAPAVVAMAAATAVVALAAGAMEAATAVVATAVATVVRHSPHQRSNAPRAESSTSRTDSPRHIHHSQPHASPA